MTGRCRASVDTRSLHYTLAVTRPSVNTTLNLNIDAGRVTRPIFHSGVDDEIQHITFVHKHTKTKCLARQIATCVRCVLMVQHSFSSFGPAYPLFLVGVDVYFLSISARSESVSCHVTELTKHSG